MAIFNKGNRDTGHGQTTIISSETFIKGEFKIGCILHIDGTIEGEVASNNTVIIGKNGTAKGMIRAKRLIINGKFFGNVEAEFVEILNGGVMVGDILAKNLGIEVGAKFNGKSGLLDDKDLDMIDSDAVSEPLLENK